MDRNNPPFQKGSIVSVRKEAHLAHSDEPYKFTLLRVTKIAYHPKGCQSGWTVNVKGSHPFPNPNGKGQVKQLIEFDSSWFKPYKGGTVLAGEEQ